MPAYACSPAHAIPRELIYRALDSCVPYAWPDPQLPPFLSSTWFPDRRGLVVSIYMSFFGSGMLIAVPVLQKLLADFRTAPTRIGGLDEVAFTLGDSGQRLAVIDGIEREVIVATSRDLVESGFGSSGVSEGVFLLGTGSNGVCESMVAMGGGVFCLMQAAAWGYRLPASHVYEPTPTTDTPAAPDITNDSSTSSKQAAPSAMLPPVGDVTLPAAMATPNMYLLFAGSVGVCMTG